MTCFKLLKIISITSLLLRIFRQSLVPLSKQTFIHKSIRMSNINDPDDEIMISYDLLMKQSFYKRAFWTYL